MKDHTDILLEGLWSYNQVDSYFRIPSSLVITILSKDKNEQAREWSWSGPYRDRMNGLHQPKRERSFLNVSGRRLFLTGINYYFFPHCLLARIIEASWCSTFTTKPLFFTILTPLILDIAFVFLAHSLAIQPMAPIRPAPSPYGHVY